MRAPPATETPRDAAIGLTQPGSQVADTARLAEKQAHECTQPPSSSPTPRRGFFGHAARLDDRLAGDAVLAHTVARAMRVEAVERVVLIHPASHHLDAALLDALPLHKPLTLHADPDDLEDGYTPRRRASRAWAPAAWRGGLGSATCYDELLPAAPLLAALDALNNFKYTYESAVVIRGDWCVFDPTLADRMIAAHAESPAQMSLCFTQAPPGFSGLVVHRSLLEKLAAHPEAGFGKVLGYNPATPTPDPVAREVNTPVDAAVRDAGRRFVYDTPRGVATIRAVAERLGSRFAEADAAAVVAGGEPTEQVLWASASAFPGMVTLELTPRREARGPITPQGYVNFQRPDLEVRLAERVFEELAEAGEVALTLGGLGEPLLHPDWERIVRAAKRAGVMALCVETDLLCDSDDIKRLIEIEPDVISVRLNADTSKIYRSVMGVDAFDTVATNLRVLFSKRKRGYPWIVPRLIKTPETLADMESFFERWLRAEGAAVIEPARPGCGLMPVLSPVPMAPPRRVPCRQLADRMSILSDGMVALCDQDWLGRSPLGDAKIHTLQEIWKRAGDVAEVHREGRAEEMALCGSCAEWHRP